MRVIYQHPAAGRSTRWRARFLDTLLSYRTITARRLQWRRDREYFQYFRAKIDRQFIATLQPAVPAYRRVFPAIRILNQMTILPEAPAAF